MSSASMLFTFADKKRPRSNSTAEERIAALLNGVSEVAVVGNGPISQLDRNSIAKHKFIVRFNDMNNLEPGEKTTLRVMRHPSDPPKVHVDAPIWHVGPMMSPLWSDQITTLGYEHQDGARNDAPETNRIFPHCNCGLSCLENKKDAWAGASTGAIALSVLDGMPEVKKINVYGMNWAGESYHIDFQNRSLVKGCCTTCTFHQTASSAYGSEMAASTILLIIIGSVVGGFLLWYGLGELVWRGRVSGACDGCGPVVRLGDDELMKGDLTSDEEETESDEEDSLEPMRAAAGAVVAVQRMSRLASE